MEGQLQRVPATAGQSSAAHRRVEGDERKPEKGRGKSGKTRRHKRRSHVRGSHRLGRGARLSERTLRRDHGGETGAQ